MGNTTNTRDQQLRRAIAYFREAIDLWCPQAAQKEELARYVEQWAISSHTSLTTPFSEVDDQYPWTINDLALPSAVVRGVFWLPGKVQVSQRIRRLYLPHRVPHPFAATLEAADEGDVRALGARALWKRGMADLAKSINTRNADPRSLGFAELAADPHLWEGERSVNVDLEAIRGQRTRARWAADRASRGLDLRGRATVLRYVRDVLKDAPHLDSEIAAVAEEGAQLHISGLAFGLPLHFGFPSARDRQPDRDGAFPRVLRTDHDWEALRWWRNGATPMLARAIKAGDLHTAEVLLRQRSGPVTSGLIGGGAPTIAAFTYHQRTNRLADWVASDVEKVRAELGLPEEPAGALPAAAGADDTQREREQRREAVRKQREEEREKRRRERQVRAVLRKFDRLTGLPEVKEHARAIVDKAALDERRREAGLKPVKSGWHLVLTGDPGTGKTTVARLFGELFAALGILSRGHVVEAAPADCIAEYLGQTEARTRDLLKRAAGGVLFLDEAYGLTSGGRRSYGREAVNVLIAQMENRRDDLVVIAAGYESEMHDFLSSNPGLRGRFSGTLHFPPMSDEQLQSVFEGLVRSHQLVLDEDAGNALPEIIAAIPRGPGFANARAMRDLFENAITAQARRLARDRSADISRLVRADLPESRRPGAAARALAALDALIGLDAVKEKVRGIGHLARAAELQRAAGMPGGKQPVGHMLFVGNPGTGKTTVARLLGEILAAEGALPRGHVVTATRADLVGEYIGQTAPKTRGVFERAIGGVLFVDEAYTLVPDSHGGRDYGREALATLLTLMEEHAGSTLVVFAGYPADMARMVAANPGLESRIAHVIGFDDYSPAELALIALRAAERDGFEVAGDALERLVTVMEGLPRGPRFGNARTALGVLAEVRTVQALRLVQMPTAAAVAAARHIVAEDIPWVA